MVEYTIEYTVKYTLEHTVEYMIKYSFPLISPFFCSITNFWFYCQSDLLATQIKIDKAIVILSPPVFIFIPSPFSFSTKDAQFDSTSVIFPFFPSRDTRLNKFATQTMTNKTIISLLPLVSFPFYYLFILRDAWLDQFANSNKYK